jgi:hypothetical protein
LGVLLRGFCVAAILAVSATHGAADVMSQAEQQVIVIDSFTDAPGTPLEQHTGELGAQWTPKYGSGMVVSSAGRVYQGSNTKVYVASGMPSSAAYDVAADLTILSNQDHGGILGRIDPLTDTYYAAEGNPGTGIWQLRKRVHGTWTLLSAAKNISFVVGRTYHLKLELRDGSQRFYVDNVLVAQAADSDSALRAAGQVGIRLSSDTYHAGDETRGWHLDNVRVTDGTPSVVEVLAPPAFARTWARSDQPVAEGVVPRTWIWGPQPITPALSEPYVDAPGGVRTVQYFDKSRMEDNRYRAPDAPWDVTNGLLVTEMATGRMQLGDAVFEDRAPAQINVAGDLDDPSAPTYATVRMLMPSLPVPVGDVVSQRIDRGAQVRDDPSLLAYGVTAAVLDPVTHHTVASVFWAFMHASGVVTADGVTTTAPLFPTPFYATGRPLAEPYWATVRVGGTPRDVLVQCFERRCLTYTPGNPDGWQVEAGNVGRHYFQWRYETASSLTGEVMLDAR